MDNAGDQVVEYADSATMASLQAANSTTIGSNSTLPNAFFNLAGHAGFTPELSLFGGADQQVWGRDRVEANISYTLVTNVEDLLLTGGANINGTGNAFNNVIKGNAGNNTLDGGAGADNLIGGLGNDIYIVDSQYDRVVENFDEGTDTVQSSISFVLGANFENLTLTGSGAINGSGNELNNTLNGNSGNNILDGGAGNDTLDGGAGSDTLKGGYGDDIYYVDNIGDQIIEEEPILIKPIAVEPILPIIVVPPIELPVYPLPAPAATQGVDLVNSSISYSLAANVEHLTLTGSGNINGSGNELNNILNGNSGNNILDGGAGNDTLNGGAGADTLMGGEGNDSLNGGAGADTLNGGTGLDSMTGGSGNDIYIVDSISDQVVESDQATGTWHPEYIAYDAWDNAYWAPGYWTYVAIQDIDQVNASVSYILGANLENLTLTGTDAINGTGNDLANILSGNSAANLLDGGSGNDTLDGGAGADTLTGGYGNDTYIVDNAGDQVVESSYGPTYGTWNPEVWFYDYWYERWDMTPGYWTYETVQDIDQVNASVSYILGTNLENLTLTGADAINGTGNAQNNILVGNAGANVLDGGSGADSMSGGLGNDTYIVDNSGDTVSETSTLATEIDSVLSSVSFTLGNNLENLTLTGAGAINGNGNALNNTITGNAAANVLAGGAGDDVLDGGAGNDTLDGGSGLDTLTGGLGNDTYMVDNVGDVVSETSTLATEIDTVQSSISYILGNNLENLTLTGSNNINGTGNELNNILNGNSGNNILDGGTGNDTLNGGAGADTLIGGTGLDTMAGGDGNDTYLVDNIGDVVNENGTGGTDNVQASVSFILGTNLENLTLTGTDAINGTGNDLANILSGNSAANLLDGGSGNDTLDGGAGADTLTGGYGNDTYIVDNAGDQVVESSYGPTYGTYHPEEWVGLGWGAFEYIPEYWTYETVQDIDQVNASVSYILGTNLENLTLTGTDTINGTGNAQNNILVGNAGANILDGGSGADSMSGGLGNDTYIVDNSGDAVSETSTLATEIDNVLSSVSFTLGNNLENLTLTGSSAINGNGNALNNIITGNAAANVLAGGLGNDTYIVDNVGDVVSETSTLVTEIDNVLSSVSYTLSSNVENLTLTGAGAINGTGNGISNQINGNDAANVLNGGLGADTLIGGLGNDTYVVDNSGDVVIETSTLATEIDNVQSSVSFTLSSNVENLTLTGTAAINGIGNALDNVLTGNTGANVLDGGAGVDTMAGGMGNDTYVVDNIGDVVIESSNYQGVDSKGVLTSEIDTVQSSISFILGAYIENLTLTGTDAISGSGNELNNILTGNAADNVLSGGTGIDVLDNDVLDGGAGADTMYGGFGNDTYYVDNFGDQVIDTDGLPQDTAFPMNVVLDPGFSYPIIQGMDLVNASISYTLGANIENLTLIGTSAINGTGNEYRNNLMGNAAANVLDGGSGSDTMSGGLGNDTYIVDNAGDIVNETSTLWSEIDTVQSSLSYTLGSNLENLTLLGTDAINGTGNALNNTLVGNAATNVLDGGAGYDILNGGAGDDSLNGGTGIDTLIGGQGNDTLLGGAGNDFYIFNPGDGNDTIVDSQGISTLYIGGNLNATNLVAVRDGDNMIVQVLGSTDSITLTNWFVQSEGVNRIEFANGSTLDHSGILALVNTPPVANPDVLNAIEDGGVVTLAAATLLANDTDQNSGDVISVVSVGASAIGAGVALVNGQVQYDIGNRFQELAAGQTATDSFSYTISDSKGATASSVVNVTITGVNDAAITANDTDTVQEDVTLSASGNVLANDSDVDQGTVLTVANAGTFNGTYGQLVLNTDGSYSYALNNNAVAVQSLLTGQIVTESFTYQATDGITATASTLNISITGTNDAPVVSTAITAQTATEDATFNFTVPAGSFTDVDAFDMLTYSATLTNSTALPSWMTFNATTQTFSGTPANGDVGDYNVTVTATDMAGLNASSNFAVTVTNVNDAPVVAISLLAQSVNQGQRFTYVLPANSFTDVDAIFGDSLTYVATLADDTALPNWLSFNAASQTFSGTPGVGDNANLSIKVTATDSGGLSAFSTFTLAINAITQPVTTYWNNPDGSFGSDTYNPDGSRYIYSVDAAGISTDAYYNTAGQLTFSNWSNPNGSSGEDTYYADGTRYSYSIDAAGVEVDSYYNAAGQLTVSYWNNPNGSSGEDIYNADGTHYSYSIDAAGNETNGYFGGVGNDVLNGGDGNDILDGGAGNDTLDGGAGSDKLFGGLGNDTYLVDAVGDVATEYADEGIDTVQSTVTYTLSANLENLILTGTTAINGTGNALDNTLTGNTGNNLLNGGAGADLITGGLGNDTYVVDNVGDVVIENTSEGTDTVQSSISYTLGDNLENLTLTGTAAIDGAGNALNNVLTGNIAANILTGGLGNDTYVVDNSGDVVAENANEGTDNVRSSITYTLGDNLENLNLTGTAAIDGTGNALNNVLTGNIAANILTGGLGNDTYVVNNSGDVVAENANEGTDTVSSSITYTLGGNLENLTLTGTAAINGTGNALNNVLTGNTAINTLNGDDGNDTLNGAAGADILLGGLGNDTYVVDNIGDVITENLGEGIDLVQSTVTYTLADNVENITLTGTAVINATGNALNNVLTGNAAANELAGDAGDDTYVVSIGDIVTEAENSGIDKVQSALSYTLGMNVENLTLTGTVAINGTGNELDNVLLGNSGINTLTGGAGNDTLNGAAGADILIGGLGDDIYVVDNAGDVVTENLDEGTDTVQSSVTHTLAGNVENLTLTGTTAISGTGNTADNVLRGNAANNTLTAGAGNDLLNGGAGNDTLKGDAGNDVLEGADGNDTLSDTAGNNLLNGGAGIDTMSGNSGNELFIGGLGNDTITTGTGADIIAFNKGDGQDTVVASTGTDNTISLGGGIQYVNLAMSKSGNNLIFSTGAGDQITLQNWYASSSNQSVANLQIVLDGSTYNPSSSDTLLNQQVQSFNFATLAANFDTALAATPTLTSWSLTDALLTAHLAGSDTAALGGDLAYQYNLNNSLAGIGLASAQTVMNDANFGTTAQTLKPLNEFQVGVVKLG